MQSSNVFTVETVQSFTFSAAALFIALTIVILLVWRIVWHEKPPKFAIHLLIGLWVAPLCIGLLSYTLLLASPQSSRGGVEVEFWACGVELKPALISSNETISPPLWSQNPLESKKQWTLSRSVTGPTIQSLVQSMGGDIQKDSIILPLGSQPESWLANKNLQDGDPQGNLTPIDIERYTQTSSNNITASFSTGQNCPGSNTPQELQIFVLRSLGSNTYTQSKITNPEDYALQTNKRIPPADCVIVEFIEPKSRTDKLCPSYGIVDSKRCASFGARNVRPDNCTFTQIQERNGD